MLNTSARLLRLLALLETRRDWSGAQLAERLEVSTRTVRNDVARLRRRVNALQAYTVAVASTGPTVDPHMLAMIAGACRDLELIRIDYKTHDGTESTRSVEPYRLVHLGRRWYLVAWDRDRLAWRTFRVDRMQVQRPTGPHFTPRELPAEDIAAYVTRSVRSAPQRYEARVIVKAPADVIAERVPRDIAVEPIDDNTCAVLARSNSVEMLALYLGMLDADFVVTDPPELVARMSTLAGRYAAAADAG